MKITDTKNPTQLNHRLLRIRNVVLITYDKTHLWHVDQYKHGVTEVFQEI